MDERHWWFASKLQETFQFGGYDTPTLLEDFLSEPDVVDLINKFLSPGLPRKLFFYCDAIPLSSHCSPAPDRGEVVQTSPTTSRSLRIVSQLTKDVLSQGDVCLYVLRTSVDTEVDASMMEKELYCGELKHSVLSSLATLLAEVYNPVLHSQRNWRECSDETVTNFLQNFNKFSSSLSETSSKAQIYNAILRRPGQELKSSLLLGQDGQHKGEGNGGGGRGLEGAVRGCELLVGDWIGTIESLLIDTTDERLEDPNGNLMSELNKWLRRQTMIYSVVEQLKSKECKTVLATLVINKSHLIKKWRMIDLQITDAFNNARDRVHYLEALSPHLDPLGASPPPSPSQIISITLPSLMVTMKQMEGVSRVYARSGYLGILFLKLSNTLVRVCVSNLESYCSSVRDQFCSLISDAIKFKAQSLSVSEPSKKAPRKGQVFISMLESFLQLSTAFKDFLSQFKEIFHVQHVNFSHSVSLPHQPFSRKATMGQFSSTKKTSTTTKHSGAADDTNTAHSSGCPSGISLQNTDKITSGMTSFTLRVSNILEMISALGQYTRLDLEQKMRGLPRFAGLWVLELLTDGNSEGGENSLDQSFNRSEGMPTKGEAVPGDGTESTASNVTLETPDYLDMLAGKSEKQQQQQQQQQQELVETEPVGELRSGGLSTLKEESWVESVHSEEQDYKADTPATTIVDTSTTSSSLSQTLKITKYQSSDHPADSVGYMVRVYIQLIKNGLQLESEKDIADVFGVGGGGKGGSTFLQSYQEYSTQVAQLDSNICLYLKAVFSEKMSSSRSLDIISRFHPISCRPMVREALERGMLTSFNRYALELEEVQDIYEKDKAHPNVSRNVPPVAEAVQWARQLLRKVEEPMEVFRNSHTVMQSMESVHVCKLHNRLATTLLKYESLWLNRWRSLAESGRGGLKAPLLVQEGDSEDSIIKVNCSHEMLELLAESKCLVKLSVDIPEAARHALSQELRVKQFKQQLELVLDDFYSVKSSINCPIRPLLTSHIDTVIRSLLPGWTTLTWSTMNIDAFLHRVQGSVEALRVIVTRVEEILKERVYGNLEAIKGMSLFDMGLATSRTLHLQDFVETIVSSTFEESNKVLHLVSGICTALIEILTITSPHRNEQDTELHSFQPLPLKIRSSAVSSSRSSIAERVGTTSNSDYSNKSTPDQGTPRRRPSAQHSSSGTMAGTSDIVGQIGAIAEEVLLHFCEVTFDTVNNLVRCSHDHFISALWSISSNSPSSLDEKEEKEEGSSDQARKGNRMVSFNVPDSPEKVESLAEVFKQDEGELQAKISNLLSASLCRTKHPLLQLIVDVKFSIPRVLLEPSLDEVYSQLMDVSSALLSVLKEVKWWLGPSSGRPLYELLELNGVIESMQNGILQAIQGITPNIEECLESLRLYDFLWQQDLHSSYQLFLTSQPNIESCSFQVQNFMEMESNIEAIPSIFTVGPLQLSAKPIKNSLRSLAVSWKIEFSKFIHQQAKSSLDSLVSEREAMVSQLKIPVEELSQLRDALQLLHKITDLQSVVDDLYFPVEEQYVLLRKFNPHLPRSEIQKVDSLRDQWTILIELAERKRNLLLSEKRMLFEREVDKQVKSFVVETIQFRNSFDTEGPLVPGLLPNEAVARLGMFLDRCEDLKCQKELLGSVQKLLDIPLTPYPELDQTEQDISYLTALYGNYQHFLTFDRRFRQELWNEVDLDSGKREVEGFWLAYKGLPIEQQEWEASKKLKMEIDQYMEILPLLQQLHSREIRNRHWLQVMGVANCTFQLEGSIFKMAHLLDAGLLLHASAIQEIVRCAQFELQLEEKFFSVEEEWSERALSFQQYKSYGPVLLDREYSHSLLEQLEHAQIELATMLMSRHIQPLKEEAIQWAAKLASIGDLLQQWLMVQKLWHNLEAVFNTAGTAKQFPEEAVKFASTHKRWIKLMKRAQSNKNILHCCFSGEEHLSVVLNGIMQELEACKKSLRSYLQSKREAFPRFFYVSDDSLLSILSNPMSVSSIQPHLASLFGAMNKLMVTARMPNEQTPVITAVESVEAEQLNLINPVPLSSGVEQWARQVLSSIHTTLNLQITSSACSNKEGLPLPLEDISRTEVFQVAMMSLFFHWCRECEQALLQCRYDRRALPGARNRFTTTVVNKLVAMLMKNSWKAVDEGLSPLKRLSVESLAMFSLWLRDMLDDLCCRKLRDISDFEWQRFIRPYLKEVENNCPQISDDSNDDDQGTEEVQDSSLKSTIVLRCLDEEIEYGFEYLGSHCVPVLTSRANNFIIAFSQSRALHLGSHLTGPTGSGKVQSIKGIGQICGRNVLTLHCSPSMYGEPIIRTFEGLAREGSWACFSDVNNLSPTSLSVLSQMMQIVSSALVSKRTSCTLSSGKQITIQPGLAVFLTSTYPISTYPQWSPPPSLVPLIRSFSFPCPDSTVVVRAHCTVLGLKAPKALANKLITLQNMAREQLSHSCPQATLSTPIICHILKVASRTINTSKGLDTQGSKPSPDHKSSSADSNPTPGTFHSPTHHTKMKNKTSVLNLSPTAGQPLPVHVLKDHAVVAQIAFNIIGASLPSQELAVFRTMVKEVFSGNPITKNLQLQPLMLQLPAEQLSATSKTQSRGNSNSSQYFTNTAANNDPSELLMEEATKAGLVPSQSWIGAVKQLYTMAQLKHAVIVAGTPATGKTSALNTVVSALNAIQGQSSNNVKLMRVFPKSVENLSDIFGSVNSLNGNWEDGIFTSIFKKAHKATKSVTWLCMDGSLDSSWMQYLPELLGPNKSLTLSDGEHLLMNEACFKLVLETGSLEQASPASLLNSGIVYFDTNVLGWKPVVEVWLSIRNPQEAQCLRKYFQQIMDSIVDYFTHKSRQSKMYSEVGLLETCLAYLSSLLNSYAETAEVFSEIHIERLLLFSLIWSYGGILIGNKEQIKFSNLLKTLTNSLPDDDSQCSVFDYYVDESGEWDVWQSRVPLDPVLQVDMFGSVFVDTVDTIRAEVLLELGLAARKHTLLVGPHSCGKTTICKNFLQSRALSYGNNEVVKQLVLDGYSKADLIHDFMGINFHHRQGYTYGPKHNKLLECFIDDLHLPLRNSSGINSSSLHEYLRQLSDLKGIYNLQKKNEWCIIEDFVLFGALTSDTDALIDPRLRRHLAVVHLPNPSDDIIRTITSQQLQGLLDAHSFQIEEGRLHGVVEASVELYSSVREALKVSDTPGRQHYFFSLHNLVSVFQGLCQCIMSGLSDTLDSNWKLEIMRAFTDGICRAEDVKWMQSYVESLSQSKITPVCGNTDEESLQRTDPPILSAISPEIKQGDDQTNATPLPLNTLPEVNLLFLKQLSDLHLSASHFLRRYREEYGDTFNLEVSDNNLCTLVKLHRALKFSMGNCILVGSLGQELESLASFAFFLAGYNMQCVDFSKEDGFSDGMKSLFRQAGLEGKPIGVIVKESDLQNMKVIQALNSIIACGELPTLFTNDELEGLLQALSPSIKRDFPSEETDPMQYFIARLCRNLRFILCLSPTSPLLGNRAHDFKGLFQSSHLIWIRDWTAESLMETTHYFFANNSMAIEIDHAIRIPILKSLSSIHFCIMQETKQLLHVGTGVETGVKKSSQPEGESTQMQPDDISAMECRKPSTSDILVEKIFRMNKTPPQKKDDIHLPYVGPRTYLQFLECFCEIFRTKCAEAEAERKRLSKALATLQGTRDQAEEMKGTLKELRQKYDQASKFSATLIESLTLKSCQLEKLKALLGHSSSVLSAMQMVSKQEKELLENEEDDEELLGLFLDRQTTRLESLLIRYKEQLSTAEQEESVARKAMMKSKESAIHWRNKIDRNSIDQIKNLNNPPPLVCTIMELMLTLLHQYGTDKESSSASEGSSASTPGHIGMATLKKRKYSVASKLDREQWNAIQIAIGDSQNFYDLLNGLKWEDGLSTDAVNLILSKLAIPGINVPLSGSETKIKGDETGVGHLITVSMARYAAESVANMCSFSISIVEYNDSFKPYKLAEEKLLQARQELQELESSLQNDSASSMKVHDSTLHHKAEAPNLEDVVEEVEMGEEGLQHLQEEVDEIQERFDKAVIEKHSLTQTCQQLSEKLKSARNLLESLKGQEESWQNKLDALPEMEMLVANCILAAAVTIYCGPLKTCNRYTFFERLLVICKSHGFPSDDQDHQHVMRLTTYPEFMLGVPALHELVTEDLPPDSTSQQNAAIIAYSHSRTYPLILDPLGIAKQWIIKHEPKAQTVKYQDANLHSILLNAIVQGVTLLIVNISTVQLDSDVVLLDVLHCRRSLYRSKNIVKNIIGGEEMECNPNFKLYLFSPDQISSLPPRVGSLVCTTLFIPETKGIQELILDSFLQLQNMKTFQEREQLRIELYRQSEKLEMVEKELLKVLVKQEGGHIEESQATKSILALNKSCEDALESFVKASTSYSLMNEVHLSVLRGLSSQAGVIIEVVAAMGFILSNYATSYSNMLSVFLSFIEQTGSRIQGEDSLIKMTRSVYHHFMKGYFEKDRFIFSLILSEEIEISHGRATREEQDFLISPSSGHKFAIRGLTAQNSMMLETGNPVHFGKKPFEWMTDSQWQMLLLLASRFSWIHSILERLGKDGKDAMWRTVGEGIAPETINLAESLGYKLLPMQQLLILCAMRPERITQCMVSFISNVLEHGQKQNKLTAPMEITKVAKTLKADQIALALFREEPLIVVEKLQKFSSKAKVPLTICYCHGNRKDELESHMETLRLASSQGHCVLLHNIQSCPSLLNKLPSLLEKLPSRDTWKLWLSMQGDYSDIPPSLLHSSNKLVLDPPLSLTSSVLHSLSSLAGEVFSSSSRLEWLPILHSMVMLHATVCLRKHIYEYSWLTDFQWTHTHFMDAIRYMKRDFKNSELNTGGTSGLKPVTWTGIRYMISEVIYGASLTDPTSASIFNALVEHWIHTGGPKKEMGRYHIPAIFFTPGSRLSGLLQAVETTSPPLVLTAEICGLYYSPFIKLGWKDYFFPNLANLSSFLQDQLVPVVLPPLSTDSPIISDNSSLLLTTTKASRLQEKNGALIFIEKLPSFISIMSQLAEVNLSHVPHSSLATLRNNPSLLERLPLQANIKKLIEKLPPIWKKDVVSERLKKHGVDSPFFMFMKSEVSQMSECLLSIQEDLKELLVCISPSSSGDTILESPHLVNLSLSLLTLTVPEPWLVLVGPSAPPGSWPIKEWLLDLILRYSFLDRVLYGGLAKTATYWLGAFFNPTGFLNIIQEIVVRTACTKSGAMEQYVFQAELTSRDKDHVRDPPPEGELFVYGAYMWGCGFEKSTNTDFQDVPPRYIPVPLPVLHLSASVKRSPVIDVASSQPPTVFAAGHKGPQVFHCPCFISNGARIGRDSDVREGCSFGRQTLFTVTLTNSDVTPAKWLTRNLACTLRPF